MGKSKGADKRSIQGHIHGLRLLFCCSVLHFLLKADCSVAHLDSLQHHPLPFFLAERAAYRIK